MYKCRSSLFKRKARGNNTPPQLLFSTLISLHYKMQSCNNYRKTLFSLKAKAKVPSNTFKIYQPPTPNCDPKESMYNQPPKRTQKNTKRNHRLKGKARFLC